MTALRVEAHNVSPDSDDGKAVTEGKREKRDPGSRGARERSETEGFSMSAALGRMQD